MSFLPNAISWLRLLLGIAFPWIPATWRLPVVLLAALTDGADGQASRWLKAESKFGVLLDPIADKVFFTGVMAALLWDGSVTWWEFVLIGMRDVIVAVGGVAARLRDGPMAWQRMPPRWLGKIATVLQFAFLGVVLWPAPAGRDATLYATMAVSALAGIDYVWTYQKLRRTKLPSTAITPGAVPPLQEPPTQ